MASFKETFDFSKWDQASFDDYRKKQDPVADKVAELIIKSRRFSEVYAALGKIIKNSDPVTLDLFAQIAQDESGKSKYEELAKELYNYFNDESLFDFVEPDANTMEMGSHVFNFYFTHCTFALATRSLMKQYAAFNGTQVLRCTQLIATQPYRRIMETVQFVMDVMAPNGFKPEGCAIRSIQKLRLVHAMIRIRINKKLYDDGKAADKKFGDWNGDEWGAPINQQDMILAVHTFSVEIIDALIDIGEFSLKNEQNRASIEAFYMMWHHIGRALGVMDEINPVTYDDGKRLQQKIYEKQFRHSDNVDLLVPPLVGFIKKLLSTDNDKKVYAIAKYYNQSDESRAVFKEVLKIDLVKDAHLGLYLWSCGSNIVIKVLVKILFALVSNEKKGKIIAARFTGNYGLLQKVIDIASNGEYKVNGHFHGGDGYGPRAGVVDYNNLKDQPTLLSSLLSRILGRTGGAIKPRGTSMFTKNTQKP